MAHTLFKKIFEPFMMELRFFSNHLRPKSEAKAVKPPITKFEAPNSVTKKTPSVTKFEAGNRKTPITYTIRMKKKASPIETLYVRSFPKKASTPLVKFPGYPSTVRPELYFPTNWRWYAEKKEPEKALMDVAKRNRLETISGDCQRKLNLLRLKEIKRKLNDSSMLKGAHPKNESQ